MLDSNYASSLQMDIGERRVAENNCRNQIRNWNIAVPDSTPLVMDFGLGQFEKFGLIEFWIANELAAGYCGKYMYVLNGQMCPRHFHRHKHETFFVVRGEMAVMCDDAEMVLREGQSLTIEPGKLHSFRGRGPALMLEISSPCRVHDNVFEDPRVMSWLSGCLSAVSADDKSFMQETP